MRAALSVIILGAGLACNPLCAAQDSVIVRPVLTQGLTEAQIDVLMKTGNSAMTARNYAAAYDAYYRVYIETKSEPPVNIDLNISLGNALLGLGHYARARPYFQSAPRSPQSFAGEILCRAALNASDDIEVDLNAALEINLTDTRLWIALGQFYDGAGRSLEAQSTYVQALKAGANHAVIVNSLGMSLLSAGRFDAALEKFKQANAIAPDADLFDNNRRLTLALMGDYDGAVSEISEARAAHIYTDAGIIAARAGHNNTARALYSRALTVSPIWFPKAQENLDALSTGARPS